MEHTDGQLGGTVHKCFICGKELPSTKLVRITSDYCIKTRKHGKIEVEYKSFNVYIARYYYYNNSMELISDVIRRRMSGNKKLQESFPKGWSNAIRCKRSQNEII